jgi:large subunit ribosomal protein L21
MYAVIKTGGKQYRVAKDDVFAVERLAAEPGTMVAVGAVLMIGETGQAPTVGRPVVDKAAVFAEVLEQARNDKIIVFKKKRRKNYRRKKGHRQDITVLRVLAVSPTGEPPAFERKAKPEPKVQAKPAAPAAAADDADVTETKAAKKKAAPKKALAKAPAKPAAKPKKAPAKAKPKKGSKE